MSTPVSSSCGSQAGARHRANWHRHSTSHGQSGSGTSSSNETSSAPIPRNSSSSLCSRSGSTPRRRVRALPDGRRHHDRRSAPPAHRLSPDIRVASLKARQVTGVSRKMCLYPTGFQNQATNARRGSACQPIQRRSLCSVPLHDMRDRAPRRPDEQLTQVVLGSVGVGFNRLLKCHAVNREISMSCGDRALRQAELSRTCIPCQPAGPVCGSSGLRDSGPVHRPGNSPRRCSSRQPVRFFDQSARKLINLSVHYLHRRLSVHYLCTGGQSAET